MLSTNPQDDKNNHKVKLDNKNDEQRILFVYIYDFLKKNGATETAKVYLSEVDITKHYKPVDGANGSSAADNDSNSLPDVELPVNAPEGFLYEWWNLRMRNNQRARLSSLHDGSGEREADDEVLSLISSSENTSHGGSSMLSRHITSASATTTVTDESLLTRNTSLSSNVAKDEKQGHDIN
ncbi:18649_t:CDS:2 [Entrophospora sp. SA101]|nr:18649_t:CDS:2 [Entrophospora sp. SA101]